MITREVFSTSAPVQELTLKSPPNWTAVIFFGILSGLHFSISIPAFLQQRWEGYMSFIFANLFLVVSICAWLARYEMAILPQLKSIRICHRIGSFSFKRFIPFEDVHAVRLTLIQGRRSVESRLEVLCDNEDIDCPPTAIPRQQALYLAMLLDVELIKVTDNDLATDSDRQL